MFEARRRWLAERVEGRDIHPVMAVDDAVDIEIQTDLLVTLALLCQADQHKKVRSRPSGHTGHALSDQPAHGMSTIFFLDLLVTLRYAYQIPRYAGQVPILAGQVPTILAGQVPILAGQVAILAGQVPIITGQVSGQEHVHT